MSRNDRRPNEETRHGTLTDMSDALWELYCQPDCVSKATALSNFQLNKLLTSNLIDLTPKRPLFDIGAMIESKEELEFDQLNQLQEQLRTLVQQASREQLSATNFTPIELACLAPLVTAKKLAVLVPWGAPDKLKKLQLLLKPWEFSQLNEVATPEQKNELMALTTPTEQEKCDQIVRDLKFNISMTRELMTKFGVSVIQDYSVVLINRIKLRTLLDATIPTPSTTSYFDDTRNAEHDTAQFTDPNTTQTIRELRNIIHQLTNPNAEILQKIKEIAVVLITTNKIMDASLLRKGIITQYLVSEFKKTHPEEILAPEKIILLCRAIEYTVIAPTSTLDQICKTLVPKPTYESRPNAVVRSLVEYRCTEDTYANDFQKIDTTSDAEKTALRNYLIDIVKKGIAAAASDASPETKTEFRATKKKYLEKLCAIPGVKHLRDRDLQELDLHNIDLRGADLRGADLRGADLRGADLRGADLRGADLRGADLRGADLRGAKFDNNTKTDVNTKLMDAKIDIKNIGFLNAQNITGIKFFLDESEIIPKEFVDRFIAEHEQTRLFSDFGRTLKIKDCNDIKKAFLIIQHAKEDPSNQTSLILNKILENYTKVQKIPEFVSNAMSRMQDLSLKIENILCQHLEQHTSRYHTFFHRRKDESVVYVKGALDRLTNAAPDEKHAVATRIAREILAREITADGQSVVVKANSCVHNLLNSIGQRFIDIPENNNIIPLATLFDESTQPTVESEHCNRR